MKQVIVMRKDLNMRKGKMVAQGAHASMGAILKDSINLSNYGERGHRVIPLTPQMNAWLNGKFTKICVSVDSERELLDLYEEIRDVRGLEHHALIQDEGRTEFKEPTYTCLAVGPADPEILDKYTGNLELL
jgi:PTH2 family peptidyl-tRNA hydrolase